MTEKDNLKLFPIGPEPRLIYEACNRLGWSIKDPSKLAQKIKQLDSGLPAEDEFCLLISWLGKCEIVHKLEQEQCPPDSKTRYRIPDLLAVFRYGNKLVPVLIEVKTSGGKDFPKLSWRPDYLDGLRRYAESLDLPLLIAWKWKSGGFWIFFETKHLKLAKKNYNLSYRTAVTENLLGQLAGDFSVSFCSNVGFHLVFSMDKKLSTSTVGDVTTENWLMTAKDAFFTNGKMERVKSLRAGLWSLFLCSDIIDRSEFGKSELKQSFIIASESGQFAHRMLPILVQYQLGKEAPLIWRRIRSSYAIPIKFNLLREGADEGIKSNIVRYVYDYVPHTKPDFL